MLDLVREVLATLPPPYREDSIEDVALAIEHNPRWRTRYAELVAELGKKTVNQGPGNWVRRETGLQSIGEVPARRTTLLQDYSKLQ